MGGGFELPPTSSPNFKKNKKKLMRSGSLTREMKQYAEDVNNVSPPLELNKLATKKASFMDGQFFEDVKEIEEEV